MTKVKLLLVPLVVATLTTSLAMAATEVDVYGNTSTGENLPGWMFNRDTSTDTPYRFDSAEASLGDGSLHVLPIGANAADKMIAENFINTAMADVDEISYDFMIGSGGVEADKVHFYMNVYANFGESDDLKFYDCRYNVVPTVGSTSGFTTVTFDPTLAYDVTTRGGASASPYPCPAVPADMDLVSAGSNIRAFALNVGDTSASDEGLDGYLDNVVTVVNGEETTYDFEPYPRMAQILTPTTDEDVYGMYEFTAYLNDDDADGVQWAIRAGSCTSGTVYGNVDGHSDVATLDQTDLSNQTFSFTGDMSSLTPGQYCFVYNPTEDAGETNLRETVLFDVIEEPVGPPLTMDECKKGGWMTFNNPSFKNQGECVSYVQANPNSGKKL